MNLRAARAFGLVWLSALVAGALPVTAVSAEPAATWREAYQSSPARYEISLAEDAPLPPDARAQMQTALSPPGTVRQRLAVTIGGSALRVRLSNEMGRSPLVIGRASVGGAEEGLAMAVGTGRTLTFGGRQRAVIAPGGTILSDPLPLRLAPAAELVVSLYLPQGMSNNVMGGARLDLAPGDQTSAGQLQSARTIAGRPLVSGVLARTSRTTRVIVTLGDSITDANRHLMGARGKAWPGLLHERLMAQGRGADLAVVNAGIAGNRLLQPGMGASVLQRFDRDVGNVAGLSHVIVLAGINDIGFSGRSAMFGDGPSVSSGDIIAAYRTIITKAHARGAKVLLAILAVHGSSFHTDEKERARSEVNAWIRSSGLPDGVIDFDLVMRDPAAPLRLDARFDVGDHLHPNDAGHKAMAESLDLGLFNGE